MPSVPCDDVVLAHVLSHPFPSDTTGLVQRVDGQRSHPVDGKSSEASAPEPGHARNGKRDLRVIGKISAAARQ